MQQVKCGAAVPALPDAQICTSFLTDQHKGQRGKKRLHSSVLSRKGPVNMVFEGAKWKYSPCDNNRGSIVKREGVLESIPLRGG